MPQKSPHEAAVSLLQNLTLDFLPINWDRFETVCIELGLDPDNVRKGHEDIEGLEINEPYTRGLELLEMVLEEPSQVGLDRFEKPAAVEAVACVIAGFFFECMKHFEEQKTEALITLAGPVLTRSDIVQARISLLLARSLASARQSTPTSAMSSA